MHHKSRRNNFVQDRSRKKENKTYVLKRVDSLRRLLDLAPNDLGNQLCRQARQRTARRFPLHDLDHLLPDKPDLRRLSIRSLFDLIRSSLRERNSEDSKQMIIGRFDSDIRLDQSLPFSDQGSKFVGCEIQTVEVC